MVASFNQPGDQLFTIMFIAGQSCCQDNDLTPLVVVCVFNQDANIPFVYSSLSGQELLKGAMSEVDLSFDRLLDYSAALNKEPSYLIRRHVL